MTPRGTPTIAVRVDPELLQDAQTAFPAERGKAGGVGLALRKLLALALGQTLPPQYGEQDRAEQIDALEADCRKARELPKQEAPGRFRDLWRKADHLLMEAEWDRVERLRLLVLYAEARRAEETASESQEG